MDETQDTQEFDWVMARSRCSLVNVFEKLKVGVERDTKIRYAVPGETLGFAFTAEGGSFWVTLAGGSLPPSLDSRWASGRSR